MIICSEFRSCHTALIWLTLSIPPLLYIWPNMFTPWHLRLVFEIDFTLTVTALLVRRCLINIQDQSLHKLFRPTGHRVCAISRVLWGMYQWIPYAGHTFTIPEDLNSWRLLFKPPALSRGDILGTVHEPLCNTLLVFRQTRQAQSGYLSSKVETVQHAVWAKGGNGAARVRALVSLH